MRRIIAATEKENTLLAERDRCMIMLAFFGYLRTSEIANMNRKEIQFVEEKIGTEIVNIMKIIVNRKCKNSKSEDHERVIREKKDLQQKCVVRMMKQYLKNWKGEEEGPLFTTMNGERMSTDTPRGRLKVWLKEIGEMDVEAYGFHSLRAGAATESARAGVAGSDIQRHGNWKSDAYRVYIRPNIQDRLRTTDAIGN